MLINSSPDSAVVYVDSTVVSGATYSYAVTSVDSSGVESVDSNEITVTIPCNVTPKSSSLDQSSLRG